MPFTKGQSGNPAGRPRKADIHAGLIAKAEARIAASLVRYITNMEALANGVLVKETTPEGKQVVYKRPPDRQANEYLINRIMGKPTERRELSGLDGEPITFSYADTLAALEGGSDAHS